MFIVEIMTVVSLSFLKIVACNKRVNAPSERKCERAPHTPNITSNKKKKKEKKK